MVDSIVSALSWLPTEILIFVISMLPVVELRGAIPVGIAMGLPTWESFLIAILGNGIIGLVVLLVLPLFYNVFMRIKPIRVVLEKARAKGAEIKEKGLLGLCLFVAIPLPGTGVWTGCIIAYLFGMPFWKSLGVITLGMLIAGLIMTFGSLSIMALIDNIVIALLVILAIFAVLYFVKKKKK